MATPIDKVYSLTIGVQGENAARAIEFDMSAWVELYPDAAFHVLFKPYNATAPSPMLTTYEAPVLHWTVTHGATAVAGVGYTEVRAQDAETGLIKKSKIIPTAVENSVSGVGAEPPASYQEWVDAVLNSAAAVLAAAHGKQVKFEIKTETGHLMLCYSNDETVTVDTEWTEVDLGPVDAYAIAVLKGYEGTAEEFAQYMANIANGASAASASATAAAASAAEAAQYTSDAVAAWLNQKFGQISADPPLDRTLSQALAAAPADTVGNIRAAFNSVIEDKNVQSLWVQKKITVLGALQDDNYWISTADFIPQEVTDVKVVGGSAYTIRVFGYKEDGTCLYCWNGSGFSYGYTDVTEFSVAKAKTAQPLAVKFRVGIVKGAGVYTVPLTDFDVVLLNSPTYYTRQETDDIIGTVDDNIDTEIEILSAKIGLVEKNIQTGSWFRGAWSENLTRFCFDDALYLNKGQKILSAYFMFVETADAPYSDSGWVREYTVSTSGWYHLSFNYVDNINSDILDWLKSIAVIRIEESNDYTGISNANNLSVYNADVISDISAEIMAHCSVCRYDTYADNGTMWITYFQDATNPNEGRQNTIEIWLCKYNVITKTKEWHRIIKAGDTIGNYTMSANEPPYDPVIIVNENNILMCFTGYSTQMEVCTLEIDKTTFAVSNCAVCTLSDGTLTKPMTLSGMSEIYNANATAPLTGTLTDYSINTIANDGQYYYAVVNEVFSHCGWKPTVIKSADLYNWELVGIVNDYSLRDSTESEIAIIGNIAYIVTRSDRDGCNQFLAWNMITKQTLFQNKVPYSNGIKPSIIAFEGDLYCAVNTYDPNTTNADGESLSPRKNASLYKVDTTTYTFTNETDIYSVYGIHYFSLTQHRREIVMSFSEDRRMIKDSLLRSDIAFCRLMTK